MTDSRRTVRLGLVAVLVLAFVGACGDSSGRWRSAGSDGASPQPSASAAPLDLDKGRSEPVADPLYPEYGNPSIDVLAYHLVLSWSPEDRELRGEAKLDIRTVKAVDEIVLDFVPGYTVEEVTLDGQRAPAGRRANDLVVMAGRQLAADTRVVLTVRYKGRPQGVAAPSTRPDIRRLGAQVTPSGAVWSMQEPFGAATWYPANDHPSDEAVYDIRITVPAGWAGVSSGTFLGKSSGDGGDTFHWRSTDPVATYVVAFAIDKYRQTNTPGPHGIQITLWMTAAQEKHFKEPLKRSGAVVSFLERRFGPYPFPAAGSVVVPQSSSAMETQGMITFGAELASRVRSEREIPFLVEEVLAHELAHQYFGNTVTPRDWRDLWLNEGFATYVQMLYAVDRGWDSESAIIGAWRARDQELRGESGPPGRYRREHFASSNVYICPALMLHEIREEVGDGSFFGLLREWAQRHRNSHQDRRSFIAFANEYTGRDLSGLINQWLDSPTTPA